MRLPKELQNVVRRLPSKLESDHFIIHFGIRNPTSGEGLWPGGVRDRTLVLTYLDALERLYIVMTGQPCGRKPPIVGKEGKTVVYVFDISEFWVVYDGPFTSADEDGIPYIGLPYRNNEPTTQAELQRAAAEAIHEATHVFNHRERPLGGLNSEPWVWINEAMSVFHETLVMPGNPDYLRFAMNWSDMPEIPLDDPTAGYQTFMFVRYLSKRTGFGFINEVWTQAYEQEKPLEALARLLPAGLEFSSADPDDRDIFASGYCMHSYFLKDPASAGFAPEVYERYRERKITESFVLHTDDRVTRTDSLDHLACRYYRFYICYGVDGLQVEFRPSSPNGARSLKGEVAVVTKEMQRGASEVLRPVPPDAQDECVQLCARLDGLNPEAIDHIVLVVANCGLRAAQSDPDIEHDDEQQYAIKASAL